MAKPPTFAATVLLDTTVTLRGFWPEAFAADPRTSACKKLVDYLVAENHLILISVVSLSEFELGDSTRQLPATSGIELVSFDRMAAHKLALMLDPVIVERCRAEGSTRPGVRYDLQIAASAARWAADYLATLDDGQRRAVERSRAAGLCTMRAMEPPALLAHLSPQTRIEFATAAATVASDHPAAAATAGDRSATTDDDAVDDVVT